MCTLIRESKSNLKTAKFSRPGLFNCLSVLLMTGWILLVSIVGASIESSQAKLQSEAVSRVVE